MSQSATLYRVSKDTFIQLNKPDNKLSFDINSAKSYSVFLGSFMGLNYILSKGQNDATIEIVNQIFYPKQSIGEQGFEGLTPEEQFEYYESGLYISYLDPSIISKILHFISNFSQTDLHSKYDAKELNDNGIYPEIWHNDNSHDQAFNERHILEDLDQLKIIIQQANIDGDYIFVFVG